jgi:hypothetical protein
MANYTKSLFYGLNIHYNKIKIICKVTTSAQDFELKPGKTDILSTIILN